MKGMKKMQQDIDRKPGPARGEMAIMGPVDNPLDYITEDHMREREICALIDQIVPTARITQSELKQMLDFLEQRLPQHLADEEIDLFPMMLRRCDPDDEIEHVIDKLTKDHDHAVTDASDVVRILKNALAQSQTFSTQECEKMSEFAHHSRRHLILENAIILPIARARLTEDDMHEMKQHMRERRGL